MLKYNPVKRVVKRCLQHASASFALHKRPHRLPLLLVLMYHRVLPLDDERSLIEEPGMIVTPDTFKNHLNIVKELFDIISLSDWLSRKTEGRPLPSKACAITFDDGWADNYDYAFPILRENAVPATIFLVSDMIGTGELFWPERLARLLMHTAHKHPDKLASPRLEWLHTTSSTYPFSDRPPTREELSDIIDHAKRWNDKEINNRLDHTEKALKLEGNYQPHPLLSWEQVDKMIQSGLIEIGSHTCRHTRLNANTPDELVIDEVVASKKHIETQIGQAVKTFCFPNGDYTSRALKLVEQNYLGAVTTEYGWNTADADSHLLRRIGVHEDIANDRTSFLSRISGWM